MTDEELTELIKKVSQKYFGKPFVHKANFNSRLKTTGGRFHLKDRHIDINPRVYQIYGMPELVGVIKHELCHYHLYNAGLRYAPKLTTGKKMHKNIHLYECSKCHLKYQRVRKLDTSRYVCGKCHGKLKFVKDIQMSS